MNIKIEKITAHNQNEALSFLSEHENTAVFLLGNLEEYGPNLGSNINSGNFKLIREKEKIVCVFCLTKRGHLLIQSELFDPLFELILSSCKEEASKILGIIGDWTFAIQFWEYLKDQKIITKEIFHSKDVNYVLLLNDWKGFSTKEARCLETKDYEQWKTLRLDYLKELNIPEGLSDEERYHQFIERCQKNMIWGLFIDSDLISIANLNAKTDRIATVGGVYTIPKSRMKGYGKILMNRLIYDCKNQLSLHKLIIFTGESENKPAQKLYESLGCQKVGYMALLFGE